FVVRAMDIPPGALAPPLRQALDAARGAPRLSLADALALLRAYQVQRVYAEAFPLGRTIIQADDARRYIIERDVRVRMADGVHICAIVVRPRGAPRLPALLEYTIYADTAGTFRESRRTASNDYVAVTGFTRGKLCSDAPKVVPYRKDGADAATLIDWISRQPWSDGRVGMYEGSYEGFTQWAAVKHMPPALKTIMAGATNGPGIDTPYEGNIAWNFLYPWPLYTTDNRTLDDSTYFDRARWAKLDHDWYASGRPYRDLETIDGAPNPVFDEWMAHPEYDAYWQALIPYRDEFARVSIPILQTAGYYYGGPGAVLYYFREHTRYNPRAQHYLVLGPWDHIQGQRGVVDALGDTSTVIAGYEIDPVARISIMSDLRYQWFDCVFKGKPRPALLADKVNYEVVGANVWRHAPSIAAMSNASVRLYLSADRVGSRYRLRRGTPGPDSSVGLTVDLRDRSDVDRIAPGGAVEDTAIDTANAIVYVSDPFPQATEIGGLFSGHLDFVTNKKDFDFAVSLFELTSDGKYMQLPPFQTRASYDADISHRHLLTPGALQHLDFTSIRLIAHRMRAGSRLVAVVSIIKNPGQEIDYGTGGIVRDESIADAGEPLHIAWRASSYLDIPVRR
ncbi:MAG TPA: CocE/NonD family hydrolase, partial [Gemmatimonadaceae bacterium]|nr:CocE/NonD family hydrolase [Gemmatimonadaceae bacterium]